MSVSNKSYVIRPRPKSPSLSLDVPRPVQKADYDLPQSCDHLEALSPRLLRQILFNLDLHSFLQCRLLSHTFKSLVEQLAPDYLQNADSWNPYFNVRRYFDLNTTHVLGYTRLESASAVKQFVEKHCPKTTDSFSRKPIQSPSATPPRPAWNSPQGHIKFRQRQASKPPSKQPSVKINSREFSILFPLASLHIRRRLKDYPSESGSLPFADSHTTLLLWTTRLLQNFGNNLTSFTLDTGKRSGSDLTFAQLRTLLVLLPNLRFLGISAGNYEHPEASYAASSSSLALFPPHRHLKSVWLGYNTTFHLHMDILNAYGAQLTNLTSSKFGYLLNLPPMVCTVNSLQKMLDYVETIQPSEKCFSSLESLKCSVVSSDILQNPPPPLPKLKRLSIHYLHMSQAPTECQFKDILQFLQNIAQTLQNLCLDFTDITSFIQWLSEEETPVTPPIKPSFPKLHTLQLSSIFILRSSELSSFLGPHFPVLRNLTFFNWFLLQEALEARQADTVGDTQELPNFSIDIPAKMNPFFKVIPSLERLAVLNATYDSDWVYLKKRQIN